MSQELVNAVSAMRARIVDALVPTATLVAERVPTPQALDLFGGRIRLRASTPQGDQYLSLTEGAHRQLADRLGVPFKYWERMLDEAPQLSVETINEWHRVHPEVRLYRMLRPKDTQDAERLRARGANLTVRAVLSDRFRPLDHLALLNTVLPETQERGATVENWTLTEERMLVKFRGVERDLGPTIAAYRARAQMPPDALKVNDVVNFGLSIGNSETGHGSLFVEPWTLILRCFNGLRVLERMRVAHLGRVAEGTSDYMAVDTRRLDDGATFLKVRDSVRNVFRKETQDKVAEVMAIGASTPLVLPGPVFEWLGNVGASMALSEAETEVLKEEVMRETTATGRALTPFALSQGITATAKRSPDALRAHELSGLGWTVLEESPERLLAAGKGVRKA